MVVLSYGCVFFFKQKTAYEMRISDWSSDVCSSDLQIHLAQRVQSGNGNLLRIYRFVFRTATGGGAADPGYREPARWRAAADRAGDNRSWRDSHVYRRLHQSRRQGRKENGWKGGLAARRQLSYA